MSVAAFIGLDWGTSNVRAWLVGREGEVLGEAASAAGMGRLDSPAAFEAALDRLIHAWPKTLPVLACGMVGARQGWREAPYIDAPATLPALAARLVSAPSRRNVSIVPGVALRSPLGLQDVMRGEETQVFGLEADGVVVCPGTHSKWIEVRGGAIEAFDTYMTGESFALFAEHSILRLSVGDGEAGDAAFDDGVRQAQAGRALLQDLFGVRVASLDGRYTPPQARAYLSGLLIGSEIASRRERPDQPITVVGDGALAGRYARALEICNFCDVAVRTGNELARKGLWRLWKVLND